MDRKKTLIRAAALALALLVLMPFCGCGNRLKFSKGGLTDTKKGITYRFVSGCYFPKAISEEVYATFKHGDVSLDYFPIEGLSPEEWLVSETGDVVYSGGDRLPDLKEFGAESMLICYNSEVIISFAEITDPAFISKVIDAYYADAEPKSPNYDSNTYRLMFSSPKYPALYYMLYLVSYEGGTLLCESGRTGVDAGTLFDDYIEEYVYPEDSQ